METLLIGINPSLLFTVDGRGLKKLKSTSRTVPTRQRDKIIPHKVLNIRRKDNKNIQQKVSLPNPHFDTKPFKTIIQRCNDLWPRTSL